MRTNLSSALLACGLLVLANGCASDDDAGPLGPVKHLYIADSNSSSIVVYDDADTVDGDVAPTRLITGASTLISTPYGLDHDSRTDSIFLGNWDGSHVLVFDGVSGKNGDVAPSREIAGASTGIVVAHDVAVDEGRNLLYVAGDQGILVFTNARTVDGDVAPARVISGPATQISGGSELRMHLDAAHDRMYVTDPNASPVQVLVFNAISTKDGDVAPERRIAGANTTLNYNWGIAVDVRRNILYVGDQSDNSVHVFAGASTATGDIAPTRKIKGAASLITGVSDVWVDEENDVLFVVDANSDSILIFEDASTLDGDVAPTRTISGSNTGLGYPGSAIGVR